MAQAAVSIGSMRCAAHPNEFDTRRIERALERRRRYRYVTPRVVATVDGYRVEAPCCSRNVDPEGGVVDVALLVHDAQSGGWRLFARDHGNGTWLADGAYSRIDEALKRLNEDPERVFWQ